MNQARGNYSGAWKTTERGSSRVNFLITMVVIAAIAYAGYQYVPVAYQASQLKVFMQDTVDNAVITGKDVRWTEDQLRRSLATYGVPSDARVTVATRESRMEAHVEYAVPVPLMVTTCRYVFDHTARSGSFLSGGG